VGAMLAPGLVDPGGRPTFYAVGKVPVEPVDLAAQRLGQQPPVAASVLDFD
jgi:hypothetical protein